MTNLRIVTESLTKTATLSASSTATTFVIDNVKLDSKGTVWRSVGTSESITATFSSSLVSCVSLPMCNLSSTATMRVRAYTLSVDATPALDTGAVLCCEYTSSNTTTYATLFFAELSCQKVIVDIADTANADGYIQTAFLVVGQYFSPTNNADYGATLSFNDTSKHKRNKAGDLMTARGSVYKSLKFTLKNINEVDRNHLMNLFMIAGISKPFFISFFPLSTDKQEQQLYQIYGKQKKLGGFTRIYYGADKAAIDIQEV